MVKQCECIAWVRVAHQCTARVAGALVLGKLQALACGVQERAGHMTLGAWSNTSADHGQLGNEHVCMSVNCKRP